MPHVGLIESGVVDYLSRLVEKIGAMALFLLSEIFEHYYRRRSGKRRKSVR
jgi:hypothetical protein